MKNFLVGEEKISFVESLGFSHTVMATSLYLCIYASLIKRLCVSILWIVLPEIYQYSRICCLINIGDLLPSPCGWILGSLHFVIYHFWDHRIKQDHFWLFHILYRTRNWKRKKIFPFGTPYLCSELTFFNGYFWVLQPNLRPRGNTAQRAQLKLKYLLDGQ